MFLKSVLSGQLYISCGFLKVSLRVIDFKGYDESQKRYIYHTKNIYDALDIIRLKDI